MVENELIIEMILSGVDYIIFYDWMSMRGYALVPLIYRDTGLPLAVNISYCRNADYAQRPQWLFCRFQPPAASGFSYVRYICAKKVGPQGVRAHFSQCLHTIYCTVAIWSDKQMSLAVDVPR